MGVPSPIISETDVSIAARIKSARKDCALSQTALGHALGVTFQQIQKYERPSNRVSAATLFRMAQVLGRPIEWFFESPAAGDAPVMAATPSPGVADDEGSRDSGKPRSLALGPGGGSHLPTRP